MSDNESTLGDIKAVMNLLIPALAAEKAQSLQMIRSITTRLEHASKDAPSKPVESLLEILDNLDIMIDDINSTILINETLASATPTQISEFYIYFLSLENLNDGLRRAIKPISILRKFCQSRIDEVRQSDVPNSSI
jgi:hypothetical protein